MVFITDARVEKVSNMVNSVGHKKPKRNQKNPLDLTVRGLLITCVRISAISFIKVEGGETRFLILKKIADGETVKATSYVTCLEESVTDRKKKCIKKKLGYLCIFLGSGKSKILNLQERRITERTKSFMGLREGGIQGTNNLLREEGRNLHRN